MLNKKKSLPSFVHLEKHLPPKRKEDALMNKLKTEEKYTQLILSVSVLCCP